MQNVERIAFVLLISAILIVLTVTLLMLLSVGTDAHRSLDGAVFIRRMGGGV